MIKEYYKKLGVESKFVLLSVAPKGKYPLKSYGDNFFEFANSVVGHLEKYIGWFDQDRKEILQDVAFKLYTVPLIGDTYELRNKRLVQQPRANQELVEAFFVLKKFYNTVPFNNELTEQEVIELGKEDGRLFLERFPFQDYEMTTIIVSRGEEGIEFLHDVDINRDHENYYFDYVLAN